MTRISCNLEAFCDRKSFYGKAQAYFSAVENGYVLRSYETRVLTFNPQTKQIMRTWRGYSATTMRHVNAFMNMLSAELGTPMTGGKKWWCSLPMNEFTEIKAF